MLQASYALLTLIVKRPARLHFYSVALRCALWLQAGRNSARRGYHSKASELMGSPTEPRMRSDVRLYCRFWA